MGTGQNLTSPILPSLEKQSLHNPQLLEMQFLGSPRAPIQKRLKQRVPLAVPFQLLGEHVLKPFLVKLWGFVV